jgi:glycosyltransferase involved in cell wall biosynthesis
MAKKINLFVVYNSYLNSRSGSNTHVTELVANLSTMANVKFFHPKNKNIEHSIEEMTGVPILNNIYLDVIFYQMSLFVYLAYYCITNKPDVIYNRQDNLSISSLVISKIFRISYIVEVNGLLVDEAIMYNRPSIFIKLLTINENLNYRLCNKIISVTEGVKRGLINLHNLPHDKIVVVNNGANTNLFYPMDQDTSRKKLSLEATKNYICFIGHLAPWQGIEYLIQAAPRILEKKPDTLFLIVGDGIMKNDCVRLADNLNVSDHFLFTGSVPYETVPFYINASDVCVVPKKPLKSGYSPLKLYEYMACGKPIVASNVNGFEILRQIDSGILINPDDSLEFSKTIIKLLSDIPLRKEMGINGRKYVEKHQSWKVVSKKVLTVCKDIIEEKY